MDAIDTQKLKVAVEDITLGALDLNIDWASFGPVVEASQALMLVESACLALSGDTVDAAFDEPAVMPPTRFDRVRWYAKPTTRAILTLFYSVDKDVFIELQGLFRHIEKNDPLGRRSRNWDGEFVHWALRALSEARSTTEAEAEPSASVRGHSAESLPDVEAVDLSPIINDLVYKLGYGRMFAGKLRAEWWPSEGAFAATSARGVPVGFARSQVRTFINVYGQEKHGTTRGAEKRYVEYIVNRFKTALRLVSQEYEK